MDRSRNEGRRARRTRRQRVHDALGYVALVVLIALIAYRHAGVFSRAPDPQLAIVDGKAGSARPAADR
jgi:hypothetical protein